jgi:hypothetical protein
MADRSLPPVDARPSPQRPARRSEIRRRPRRIELAQKDIAALLFVRLSDDGGHGSQTVETPEKTAVGLV